MRLPFRTAWLVAAGAAAALGACASSGPGTCAYQNDGVCDEPRNCPLGTDDADCAKVCAKNPDLAPIACEYRGAPTPPSLPLPQPAANGSHGAGGARGTWDGSIQALGPDHQTMVDRYYRVYVPRRYDPSQPTPVIYLMIGFATPLYGLPSYTEMERTADLNGFIVVYLEAMRRDFGTPLGEVWDWSVYADGTCAVPGAPPQVQTCQAAGLAGSSCATDSDCASGLTCEPTYEWLPAGDWSADPEVDFVRRLTAHLEALYNVDRTRVYVGGHSRGAGESIILAFELPDLVAGFVEESGFVHIDGFDQQIAEFAKTHAQKVHGVIVHGTIDNNVDFCEAEDFVSTLNQAGYVEGKDYLFFPLLIGHRWQSWLNQEVWDFLYAHPLDLSRVTP